MNVSWKRFHLVHIVPKKGNHQIESSSFVSDINNTSLDCSLGLQETETYFLVNLYLIDL